MIELLTVIIIVLAITAIKLKINNEMIEGRRDDAFHAVSGKLDEAEKTINEQRLRIERLETSNEVLVDRHTAATQEGAEKASSEIGEGK